MDFVTAFVGLPSSGKSSIINSLCFKRLLQSGVCRTTTEYKKLDIDIFDDFNNKFKVIDLPGISDSEENEMKFNDLTYTHIIDANLIVWVSDVHKSFITTHEVDEYNKLKDFITKRQEDTGTIYKIVIMLSKCDKEINYTKKPTIKLTKKNDLEEITDLEEYTDINDLVNKVKEKFPNEDIILFNAYGRSYHNEKSSNTLKTFIRTISGIPKNVNTTFDISKYMKNYVEEQKISYELKFESVYKIFINLDGSNCFQYAQMIINNENKDNLETILNKLNASKLIQLWKKLDKQFIISHLIKICSADYDRIYQNYLYIIFVVKQLNNEIIKNEQYNIILMRIIDYELSMLNSTDLTMLNFHGLNKCGSIINTIMNTFNK
jgi:GTPase Era involved in 16S rRNA processing